VWYPGTRYEWWQEVTKMPVLRTEDSLHTMHSEVACRILGCRQ